MLLQHALTYTGGPRPTSLYGWFLKRCSIQYATQFLNRPLHVTTVCSAATAVVVAMAREGQPGAAGASD